MVSTVRSQPPMVADDLQRQADTFLELTDLEQHIARSHAPRDDRAPHPRDEDYEDEDDLL